MDVSSLYTETAIAEPTAEVSPDTPCEHCQLPVGSHPEGEGPFFCCTGCMLVYDALQTAGLGNTYYNLKKLTPDLQPARPAKTKVDKLRLSEIDTETFLEAHTQPVGNGHRTVTFFLDGVHCAACVWLVERMPFEVAGVSSARLDLSRARLALQFDPSQVKLSEVATWLAQFGYTAHPAHEENSARRSGVERRLLIKMGISWAIAGNVMLFAFSLYAGLDNSGDTSLTTGARWASFFLALIAVGYGGSEFFQKAWASMKLSLRMGSLKHLHMDTPISLGILVGFSHSAWATITGAGEIWFDSITVLIAALLTARWLQLRSRRLAGDASDRLLDLIPTMARLTSRFTGANELDILQEPLLVRVDQLQRGEVVEVPAGEVIPVDGTIVSGSSTVDKSVLTGESRPEKLEEGMWIEAGVTNLESPVQIRVEAAGDKTRVGKLMNWIRSGAEKRAPVVLLADRLSGYFVITLLLVAAATALGWMVVDPSQTVPRVVALLVISCPCALGMATPLAMAVAAGRAARVGVFIKSDEATQQLNEVDAVVLDKTGTLTEGRMSVVDWVGDADALEYARLIESMSNHPVARAIRLSDKSLASCDLTRETVSGFKVVAGSGVLGTVVGHEVLVGSPDWVDSQAKSDPVLEEKLQHYAEQGYTPIAIAMDGVLKTAIAVGDGMRQDADELIRMLQSAGKDVFLLSGDHEAVVQSVAGSLGIERENARGGVSPEGKKAFLDTLRSRGYKTIAMVGDGVNDAVALQTADVGIAVEGGSMPSQVAADVFLTRGGLKPIVQSMEGAGRVMGVIRRNLTFSLVYNILGASAAILGLVTPLVAAIAMPISSLVVVIASITQRTFLSTE